MVFWQTYPIKHLLHSHFNNKIFKSLVFERDTVSSPTGVKGDIIQRIPERIREVKEFIKNYFGNPPHTPILDIPEEKLLGEKDYILIVRDNKQNIVGCIRYHYLGQFVTADKNEIYCEDCFCIHPKWRKKGVGDYLLTTLHIFVNQNNIPYSIFLKEGAKLSITHSPYYSSMYVFRETKPNVCSNIINLEVHQAYKLMNIFTEFDRSLFIIRNKNNPNQYWRLYIKGECKILACFQDTYQRFEKAGNMKRIGWITGWLESADITDNIREEASKELSDSLNKQFDFIWADMKWIGNSNHWKIDGSFSWYLYQWTTSVSIKKSYCILN
jgi:GNAT superfamily N-acetyltransferase